jgi:hypothetical protein
MYVCDKHAGQKDTLIDVPRGGRFADMVALKEKENVGLAHDYRSSLYVLKVSAV